MTEGHKFCQDAFIPCCEMALDFGVYLGNYGKGRLTRVLF